MEREAKELEMADEDDLPPNPLLDDVNMDASLMSVFADAVKAKVLSFFERHDVAIPFNPDPDFRLEDGKRWWEVGTNDHPDTTSCWWTASVLPYHPGLEWARTCLPLTA